MKEDKLGDLSMELSVEILKLTKELRKQHETVISNQIGRSGTSIGANIHEAQYAVKYLLCKCEIFANANVGETFTKKGLRSEPSCKTKKISICFTHTEILFFVSSSKEIIKRDIKIIGESYQCFVIGFTFHIFISTDGILVHIQVKRQF